MMRQLLDIVHKAVQVPLRVHFGLAPQGEAADVSTTMIYTHVLNKGGKGVASPLDFGAPRVEQPAPSYLRSLPYSLRASLST